MTRVAALSGGERNRVILAKLFTLPSNLLVLDEPTNDLDVETLEALEDRLIQYEGTLLVVSHDRHFLDRVVTSTLVFEGDGEVKRYAGGYSDWARLQKQLASNDAPRESNKTDPPSVTRANADQPTRRKLSYKVQRELDSLPETIERMERDIAEIELSVNDPAFYAQTHDKVSEHFARLEALRTELERKMARWEELEASRTAVPDAG
jgi:ATP-binding cassette subfamily F protein uup